MVIYSTLCQLSAFQMKYRFFQPRRVLVSFTIRSTSARVLETTAKDPVLRNGAEFTRNENTSPVPRPCPTRPGNEDWRILVCVGGRN